MGMVLLAAGGRVARGEEFARVQGAGTREGYLARLLINEVPFPGERGWQNMDTTKAGMVQVLWVLHGRIHLIPKGYQQVHVAGVKSDDIMDVITGTGGRRQCEGFYRNEAGKPVTDARVEERLENLLRIANSGGKPGRFAELLNFAQELSKIYFEKGMTAADRYAGLGQVNGVKVTGRAYSWMTDTGYKPGGNFVAIPDAEGGSLGGNRFFTLRKEPR
jgi:hypothetical protein